MDLELKNDINRLFSIFLNNTQMDLHRLLPPVPAAKRYQSKLEDELEDFHSALLNRLEREFTS